MFSISEVIDMAVQLEKNGEQIYRSALESVSDAGLKQLLEWMAEEEGRHAKWFSVLRGTAVVIEDNEALKKKTYAISLPKKKPMWKSSKNLKAEKKKNSCHP